MTDIKEQIQRQRQRQRQQQRGTERQSNLGPDVVNQGDFRIAKSRLVKTLFTSINGGGGRTV